MRSMRRSKGGYTLIEMIFVMALLVLFGVTTYTLVAVGGGSYQRIMEAREDNSSLRVALSYMTMRIRQYDVAGSIDINTDENGKHQLILSEDIDGTEYVTRIYLHAQEPREGVPQDGVLRESTTEAGIEFLPETGFDIVDLFGMSLSWVGDDEQPHKAVRIEVWASDTEPTSALTCVVALRTAERAG